MINKTLADFLNERGYNAYYPKPESGDNFVEGEAIAINGELFLERDLDKTEYKELKQMYIGRLKE